ncbi:hypothetical protein [Rhodococcus artemisiae]|uniref:Uncharacterized protein n=1 Tax=Rhodococcus artemisiae TaxID=714159 RepID=A0ABU7L9M4_9NOCA|nr:hypothetical protein [Rhodococcus artemisiae]MEE2058253.1 hypothetical protein [Rhodococcus artemisiae]
MSSTVRATAGGMLIGGGVAMGAYSGGWFLILAVLFVVLGTGTIVTALSRSTFPVAGGDPVPVDVDLIDRSAPNLAFSSTLIAGRAHPRGDAPFSFRTRAALSNSQVAEIVADGRGTLPSEAVGEPGAAPVIEHGGARARTSTVVTALVAMWATMLLPPSDFWDFTPESTAAVSAQPVDEVAGTDALSLGDLYDDALAHLRSESPESLNSLLQIQTYDTYAIVDVYLGGDRARTYTGWEGRWTVLDGSTDRRTADTFTADELQEFSAQPFLAEAAAMVPPELATPERLIVSRSDDDILGETRPIVAESWFDGSSTRIHATADGTVAPWWPAEDLAAGLQQVETALAARGISAADPLVKEISFDSGNTPGFMLDYYRGDTYYRMWLRGGSFSEPDEAMSDSDLPRFRLADVTADTLERVRDDAMSRFGIDPVDRGAAGVDIGFWGSEGGERSDDIVIVVDYSSARGGGEAVYTLGGDFITE